MLLKIENYSLQIFTNKSLFLNNPLIETYMRIAAGRERFIMFAILRMCWNINLKTNEVFENIACD